MRTYSAEYSVTYRRRTAHKFKCNNQKSVRHSHRSWNKVFYGRHIGKRLYYAILEQYDSGTYSSMIAYNLKVSTALIAAVVKDRQKALGR